jgi:hypothetical protein
MIGQHQPESLAEFLGPLVVDGFLKAAGIALDFAEMGVNAK